MTTRFPARIAIIGCGFTGTTALYQLIERYPVKEVFVFETSGHFGPGYAYGNGNAPAYLMNNTTDTMCLEPSNRGAFLAWLKSKPEFSGVDPKGHLPRLVYGQFLEEVIAATRVVAAIKGIQIHFVTEEVIDISEDNSGKVTVRTATADIDTEAVILATGRCPEIDRLARLEAPGANYISTHIPGHRLDSIPLDATVHVLGASLSAYDVVNGLFSDETGCRFVRDENGVLSFVPGENQRLVVLASRTGRMKKVASRNRMNIQRRFFTEETVAAQSQAGRLSLVSLLELVRSEAEAHGARINWSNVLSPYAGCGSTEAVTQRAQTLLADDLAAASGSSEDKSNFLVDLAGDAQLALWNIVAAGLLPPEEEALYRRYYESSVLTFAAPCPIATAERLLALMHADRLSIITGVSDVRVTADGVYALPHEHGVEKANLLINVTNAVDRRIESPYQSSLYRALAVRGSIRPHERGQGPLDGIAVDMKTFRAKGMRHVYVANMLLWGPGFFTSSAFMMATVIERMLAAMLESGATE